MFFTIHLSSRHGTVVYSVVFCFCSRDVTRVTVILICTWSVQSVDKEKLKKAEARASDKAIAKEGLPVVKYV